MFPLRKGPFEDQTESFFSQCVTKVFTFWKNLKNFFKLVVEMSFDLATIVSTEKTAELLTETVELDYSFSKFFLRYKNRLRRQKQIKRAAS